MNGPRQRGDVGLRASHGQHRDEGQVADRATAPVLWMMAVSTVLKTFQVLHMIFITIWSRVVAPRWDKALPSCAGTCVRLRPTAVHIGPRLRSPMNMNTAAGPPAKRDRGMAGVTYSHSRAADKTNRPDPAQSSCSSSHNPTGGEWGVVAVAVSPALSRTIPPVEISALTCGSAGQYHQSVLVAGRTSSAFQTQFEMGTGARCNRDAFSCSSRR